MGAIWKNDFRLLWTGKRIGLLLGAALLMAVLSWAASQSDGVAQKTSEKVTIGVVNRDESVYAKMLVSYFLENPVLTSYASVVIAEEEEVRSRFEAGELDMYLIVPESFADSMMYLEHLPIEAVISTTHTSKALLLKNLLQSYAEYISAVEINCVALYDAALELGLPKAEAQAANEEISVELIMLALSKDDFFEKKELADYTAIKLLPYYMHEFCYLAAAFLALLAGVRFQREHHAGIYRRLAAMGHGVLALLAEKQLFYMLTFTLVFAGLWVILSIAGISISGSVFLYFCLHSWLLCALMLCLAAGFQKLQNYLLASNMIILLGAILGGGLIPIMYLPEQMERIARLLPNYWFLKYAFALNNRMVAEEYYIVCGLLWLGILLLLFLGGSIYRKKEGRVYENA